MSVEQNGKLKLPGGAMDKRTCVIIGAGLAGAATAYHLTRMGLERVVVFEQESMPGIHSSGRNAAMIRQVVNHPTIAQMALEGAAFLRRLPADWPLVTSLSQNGSFLLSLTRSPLPAPTTRGSPAVEAEWKPIEEIVRKVPVLEGAPHQGGIWCPTDGVVDVHSLLQGFLRSAIDHGAQLKLASKVHHIAVNGGRVTAVQTQNDEIACDVLVNAGGPWAGEIGQRAGSASVPLVPYRRHIFITNALKWVNPDWPIIWDITNEVYFRPESGGLLLSPCDEIADRPGIPPTDASAAELLAEKVSRSFPAMPDLPLQNSWAGLRTLTPDRRFVIGWDPKVQGFIWVAGLGGHGVTVSSSAGRLAAEMILRGDSPSECDPFSPSRFLES
ncbi:MAG TPA: FAD-dependent oxidoreductase [Terriglobia bacterium]|nr:FAD-dependent oxidoreductase [Terriglobia bacterium]